MPLVFVYGSLKQGFPNTHLNKGVRQPGMFRTRQRLPLYLLGEGHVPCLVLSPGFGHQVLGEVHDVADDVLAVMDGLERLGEPNGYLRVAIEVEAMGTDRPACRVHGRTCCTLQMVNSLIDSALAPVPDHLTGRLRRS